MMDSAGFSWSLMTIVGPLLLLVVLAWALMRNRQPRSDEIDRTEKGDARSLRRGGCGTPPRG
jgi:hypothetical protein